MLIRVVHLKYLLSKINQNHTFWMQKHFIPHRCYPHKGWLGSVCVCFHLLGWAHSFWRFRGPRLGLNFFEFELKPTGKDSADPAEHEFQHHIL